MSLFDNDNDDMDDLDDVNLTELMPSTLNNDIEAEKQQKKKRSNA